jgi:hypothetical protein
LFVPEKRTINKFERENLKATDEHINGVLRWLTERDLDILLLLLKHPFLTSTQIELMVFGSLKFSSRRTKCNERLRRLYHANCIDRFFPPCEKDAGSSEQHLILDYAGARALAQVKGYTKKDFKFKKRNYVPQHYKHTLKIFDFKALLYQLNRQLGVVKYEDGEEGTIGEIIAFHQESRARVKYYTEEGKKSVIIPDAFIVYKYTSTSRLKLFWLECDNATEPLEELKYKIDRYIGYYRSGEWREEAWARMLQGNSFPAICFVAHDEETIKELANYVRRKQSNIRFLFTTYDKLSSVTQKEYVSQKGKRRLVQQDLKVNILDSIWVSKDGVVAL